MLAEGDSKPRPRQAAVTAAGTWRWGEEARVAAAEAAGTALLVLLSCAGAGAGAGAAAGAGAVVAMLVQCFDHVSGAMFNPTVTLAALVWGRVGARRAAAMWAAQAAGAVAGAAALGALCPAAAAACPTVPAAGAGAGRAAAMEAVCGACLALANCASWDVRNSSLRDSWPLRIGTCVAALTLVAAPVSGASMNPARSLGPALLAARWDRHWVYWVGPLGGSLAATSLYVALWRPPQAPRDRPLV